MLIYWVTSLSSRFYCKINFCLKLNLIYVQVKRWIQIGVSYIFKQWRSLINCLRLYKNLSDKRTINIVSRKIIVNEFYILSHAKSLFLKEFEALRGLDYCVFAIFLINLYNLKLICLNWVQTCLIRRSHINWNCKIKIDITFYV